MSFKNLGLSEPILRSIEEEGYTQPTPIQKQAIPLILEKSDVLAAAQTGTGKTAGFTLPLLELLRQNHISKGKRPIRALILTPTRELAAQVGESVETYGRHLPFKSTIIFGGVNINRQINILKQGVDILIATPGRLLDLVSQKVINLSQVECLILDEADRMLDMGFIHDIKKVVRLIPKKRQTLLFSATFSKEIKSLASSFLYNPQLVEVARQNRASEQVKQVVHHVDKDRKRELLFQLIDKGNWKQVLVFTRTKHGANRLCEYLDKRGIRASAIHGNKSQGARTKALANFKANSIRVLVATDIAARGIDIDQLPHVVNFELPNVPEDYVHRIGRTGRAGNVGEALSLVCVDEDAYLKGIERLIGQKIQKIKIQGFEVDPSIKAEPIKQGGRGRGRGGNQKVNNKERTKSEEPKKSDNQKSNSRNRNRKRRNRNSSSSSN